MKTVKFNNIKECEQYYNKKTNTYEFVDNEGKFSIELLFDFNENANIYAEHIIAQNIKCYNINCIGIEAYNVDTFFIKALLDIDIQGKIDSQEIICDEIRATNIFTNLIYCYLLVCKNVNASNILAYNIFADSIEYDNVVCRTNGLDYKTIKRKAIGAQCFSVLQKASEEWE